VKPKNPPGSFNAHWLALSSASSYEVMMGAPAFIYAKSLAASSTVLGITASLSALMSIFQLPAARHMSHFGYRRFLMIGWTIRAATIFIAAAVPMIGFLDEESKLAVLLCALLFFSLARGIFSVARMPWLSQLIPDENRPRFLSANQSFTVSGTLLALLISSIVISGSAAPWQYALTFLAAATIGTLALEFIKRMPEVQATGSVRLSGQRLRWQDMLTHDPFRRLLILNVIYAVAIGSVRVFTIEYVRDFANLDVQKMLYLSAYSFLGPLVVLPFGGRMLESVGGRVLMQAAGVGLAISMAAWMSVAAGALPCSQLVVAVLNFTAGSAVAVFNLANLRVTMANVPELGRDHYFALFTVVTSLVLGTAQISWGLILDAIGNFEVIIAGFRWTRHTIYFLTLLVLNTVVIAYTPSVFTPPAPEHGEAPRKG
jgi:MFS family permease